MVRKIIVFLILMMSVGAANAQSAPPAQSWYGLTGLYLVPTARVLGRGEVAMTFAEAKHVEYVPSATISQRLMDRQINQAITIGVLEKLEVYYLRTRNLMDTASKTLINNQTFFNYGFKYQMADEDPEGWCPAVALAVRDFADKDSSSGSYPHLRNGRKIFLLATKTLKKEQESGKFVDFSLGLARDYNGNSLCFGGEMSLTREVSFIAEGIYDSPFVNFRDYDALGKQSGRFVYDTGLRIRPSLVPGLAADVGFVGDGAFEFSFGWGYVFKL